MLIPNKDVGDTVTHEEINQPFWLKSATYDAENDRIVVTIGPGRADWGGGTLTEKLTDSTLYITTPSINTTYYIFLKNDSTFIYSTSGTPGAGQVRLASIAVGATKDALTVSDLRGMLGVQDADLLDGYHASSFSLAAHGHAVVTTSTDGFMSAADKTKLDGIETGATADQTPTEILTAIKTVDGAGSGLDADLLDGSHKADITKLSAIASLVAGGNVNVAANAQVSILLTGGVAAEHRFYVYSIYAANPTGEIAHGTQVLPDETVFPGIHSYIIRSTISTGSDRLVITNGTATAYLVYYRVYKLIE